MYDRKGDLLCFSCFRPMLEIHMYREVIPKKQFSVGVLVTVWLN